MLALVAFDAMWRRCPVIVIKGERLIFARTAPRTGGVRALQLTREMGNDIGFVRSDPGLLSRTNF